MDFVSLFRHTPLTPPPTWPGQEPKGGGCARLTGCEKSKLEMQTQWAMTRNPQCTNLFTGNEHEDSRHNVVLKMRTDARCKSISGTRAQLWKKPAQRKVGQKERRSSKVLYWYTSWTSRKFKKLRLAPSRGLLPSVGKSVVQF